MTLKKGYYCLIQYCPDPSRLETVNVGAVLFCPEAEYISARIAEGNQRAAKLVGRAGLDVASLNSAKRAMERRFEIDAKAFRTLEDLQKFVDTRGNVLKLTTPRPIKVFDPPADLARLFGELVGGRPRRREAEPVAPELDELSRLGHNRLLKRPDPCQADPRSKSG